MSPAEDDCPPVLVFTTATLPRLLEARLRELRAKGVAYEVVDLDKVFGGGDSRA